LETYKQRTDLSFIEQQALVRGMKVLGPSKYVGRLGNSLIIAFTSTALAIFLGVLAAYAFSRWEIPGESDWLFFILSTRMLPAVVVTIPIFLMYRALGMYDTHFGMIMLYTCFNLSFAVWLLKGFIDEIPKEYEEAALVDGYSRMQAFRKIVLPQCAAATASSDLLWNSTPSPDALQRQGAPAPPIHRWRGGIGGVHAAGSLLF
jgi:multiple sugar transport system permease protein